MPLFGKKSKNQINTDAFHWQENPLYEGREPAQSDLMSEHLQDMENSKTRRHGSLKRFFTKGDSKEYTEIKEALRAIVHDTSGSFGTDAKANSDMLSSAAKNYHKLIAACNIYLKKGGGNKGEGKARKDKVAQILELATEDYGTVKTLSYTIRSMPVEQQTQLSWQTILQEARTATIEVDDLSQYKALGDEMKTGDDAGRLLPQGVFTRENIVDVNDNQNTILESEGREVVKPINGFKAVAFNEEQEDEKLDSGKVGKTLNLSARNVATSRIANLLGIGGIVEQSQTVKVREKGKGGKITKGNLMSLAKGSEASGIAKDIAKTTKKLENIEDRKKQREVCLHLLFKESLVPFRY